MDLLDNYAKTKKKLKKLAIESQTVGAIRAQRIKKKMRQLIRRTIEIEEYFEQQGYPHPLKLLESQASPGSTRTVVEDYSESLPGYTNPHVVRPDGTLSYTGAIGPVPVQKTVLNPDGTLFETPKLEGSFLPRKEAD